MIERTSKNPYRFISWHSATESMPELYVVAFPGTFRATIHYTLEEAMRVRDEGEPRSWRSEGTAA